MKDPNGGCKSRAVSSLISVLLSIYSVALLRVAFRENIIAVGIDIIIVEAVLIYPNRPDLKRTFE